MHIQVVIRIFLLMCLFVNASCNSCNRKQLERSSDKSRLELLTKQVSILGSVAGKGSGVIIEVGGEIVYNGLEGEGGQLLLVVIPESGSIEDAVAEFKGMRAEMGVDKNSVELAMNKGVVYYGSDLAEGSRGEIRMKTFVQGLPGGKYKGYLIVDTKSHGTSYSSPGQEIGIKIVAPADPSIAMISATAARKIVLGNPAPQVVVSSQGDAKNFGTMTGGFLFIRSTDSTTPEELFGNLVKTGNAIPALGAFSAFPGYPGVITCSFGAAQKQNILLDAKDPVGLFQRGGQYSVYSYLVDGNKYTLSPGAIEITIPQAEVEVVMGKVRIEMFRKYVGGPLPGDDAACNSISFKKCNGEITKHDGTVQAVCGFLFVCGGSCTPEVGAAKVIKLLGQTANSGFHLDGTDVAYVNPGVVANGTTGEIKTQPRADGTILEPGQDYFVYFWLRDGAGEVFLSKNDQQISTPEINLAVGQFETDRIGDHFYITHQETSTVSKPVAGTASAGYVICTPGAIPTANFCRQILDDKDTTPPTIPNEVLNGVAEQFATLGRMADQTSLDLAMEILCGALPEDTEGQPYFVSTMGRYLFYTKAPFGFDKLGVWQGFKWQGRNKNDVFHNIKATGSDAKEHTYHVFYEYNKNTNTFTRHKISKQHEADQGSDEVKYSNTDLAIQAEVRNVLAECIKGANAADKIQIFIDGMPTV